MHDLSCTINSFNPTGKLNHWNQNHQPKTTFLLLNDPKSYKVRVAQWWEHSPPVNVARVRILTSRAISPYVGWVCCWFYPSLQEVFLLGFRFSPLPKNQLFIVILHKKTRELRKYPYEWFDLFNYILYHALLKDERSNMKINKSNHSYGYFLNSLCLLSYINRMEIVMLNKLVCCSFVESRVLFW